MPPGRSPCAWAQGTDQQSGRQTRCATGVFRTLSTGGSMRMEITAMLVAWQERLPVARPDAGLS